MRPTRWPSACGVTGPVTLAASAHPHQPLGSEAEGPPRRSGDTGRIHHQHGPRAAGAIRGDPSPGACLASRGLRTRDQLLHSGPGPAPFEPASASVAGLVKAGAFIPVQGVCIPVPIVPCLPGDTESLGFSWRRSGETQSGLASLSLQIKCLLKMPAQMWPRRSCSPRSSWEPHPPPGQVPRARDEQE